MKIQINRTFRYQIGTTVASLKPGIYVVGNDITRELADKALRFGDAKLLVEKKAPENKARGKARENKSKMAKPAGRSRRARSKPDD